MSLTRIILCSQRALKRFVIVFFSGFAFHPTKASFAHNTGLEVANTNSFNKTIFHEGEKAFFVMIEKTSYVENGCKPKKYSI